MAFIRAEQVWFLNPDDAAAFVNSKIIPASKAEILYGEGIDLDEFVLTPRAEDTRCCRFILVARMLRDKGVAEYVRAAEILKTKYPHAEFSLLGDAWPGNPAAISPEELQRWHTEGNVVYHGGTSDVKPYLANADCIVLPSYREGVPRSFMEGAAMGLPIVTTDNVGCKEVVEHGVTGYLCKTRDADDLAAAMERIILMPPAHRQAMGSAGRELMQRKFDVRLIVRQYERRMEAGFAPTSCP
jgi:glycosyltransferase involved in cell wall biosynthesis